MSTYSPDFSKRDYLLPPGCKDLMDVFGHEFLGGPDSTPASPRRKARAWDSTTGFPIHAAKSSEPKIIEIGSELTVVDLANLLGCPFYQIISDLIEQGIFASANSTVTFAVAAKVARMHGFDPQGAD